MFDALRRWLGRRAAAPEAEVGEAQWRRVEAGLPFLRHLGSADRAALRAMALEFVRQKQFHGAQGLELDDDMMLSIALQACLPVLRTGLAAYRDWVGIVVYPGQFRVEREVMDEDGVMHAYSDTLLGEAWRGGPVLVSWNEGAREPGVNVVIHEFAHALDMANGGADGFPPLRADMSREAWSQAFGTAYEALCRRIDMGLPGALDPYAAEDPAEFFAVASEAFFETPGALRAAYPAVYGQLVQLYALDPAAAEDAPEP